MDTQTLPLVPFGKYKGQPITTLLNDTKYLEWCKQQEWFQKFPIIYNICVNQTIISNNQNSKTPEHNKLQNLFLEKENVEKMLKKIFADFRFKKNIDYYNATIEFEALYNWDVSITNIGYNKSKCKCDWELKGDDSDCDCGEGYEDGDDNEYNCSNIFIEIKPCLGDDYPSVLRKMKTQIDLTNMSLDKKKQSELDELGYKEGTLFGPNWTEIKWIHKNYNAYKGKYFLLIKEYNSTNTSKEKLIEIFNQTFIKIIFIDELFNDSSMKIIKEKVQDIIVQPTKEHKLENEKKILQDKLLQAEEKIKELEKEILLLKNQKQNKSIKEYFGKT